MLQDRPSGTCSSRSSVPRTTHERERVAGVVERVEEVVHARQLAIAGLDQEVAALEAGRRRGAAVDDRAHEQAVALGEPDRGAQAARDARRRERDAEPRPLARLAAGELVDAPAQRGVGGQREDEARRRGGRR